MSIRSFITAIVLLCAVSVAAQTEMPVALEAPAQEKVYPRVTGWEFQLNPIEINNTLVSIDDYVPSHAKGWRVELRKNLQNSPWSVGGMLSLYDARWRNSRFNRELGGDPEYNGEIFLLLGPTVNYDFRRGSRFNPYAEGSVGLGLSYTGYHSPYLHAGVGLELLHFIRVGVGATAIGYNSSTVGINFGLVLGGWKR